ncbi:hypothetical protein BVY04_01150, partial [bacterium M21]
MIKQIQKILREAGELSLTYYRKITETDVEYKGEVDVVTKVDKELEELLRRRLAGAFPDISFFGEEGEYGALNEMAHVFIVDPIDGTTNFVHGHPIYSISLGYREHGETKLGAVYLPVLDKLYWAERGKGAFMNLKNAVDFGALLSPPQAKVGGFIGGRWKKCPLVKLATATDRLR